MDGWVKIYRSLLDWEWFYDDIMLRGWVYILLRASREDFVWKGIEIKKGQLVTSLSTMARDLRISVQQARRILTTLKSTNEITTKTTNKYTKITICKWGSYQDKKSNNQQANQQIKEHDSQQTNQQANQQHKEKEKNNKEKEDNITPIIPFEVSPEFLPAFTLWLEYKKEKKQSYKGEKSLKATYKRLLNLSGNNPDVAMAVVEQAMANNWAGLYALKDDHVTRADKKTEWEQKINQGAWDDINQVFHKN